VESELTRFRREWEHELSQNALYNDLLLAEAIRASLADAQSFHPTPVRRQRLDPLASLIVDCLGLVLDHLPLTTLANLAQCSRAWADAVRRYLNRPGLVFHKPAWYQFDSSHAGEVPRSARVVQIGRCRVFDYDDFLRLPPGLERLSIDVSGEHQGLNLISSVPRGRLTRFALTLGQVAGGLDLPSLVPRLERFPQLRYVKVWYHLPPTGSRDDVVWHKWEWHR
jgi:predicted nucleic acid-binding Zn ribbon protein